MYCVIISSFCSIQIRFDVSKTNLSFQIALEAFPFTSVVQSQTIDRLLRHKERRRFDLWIAEPQVLVQVVQVVQKIAQTSAQNFQNSTSFVKMIRQSSFPSLSLSLSLSPLSHLPLSLICYIPLSRPSLSQILPVYRFY